MSERNIAVWYTVGRDGKFLTSLFVVALGGVRFTPSARLARWTPDRAEAERWAAVHDLDVYVIAFAVSRVERFDALVKSTKERAEGIGGV